MVQPTRMVCCAREALMLPRIATAAPAASTKLSCTKPFMVQTIRQAIGKRLKRWISGAPWMCGKADIADRLGRWRIGRICDGGWGGEREASRKTRLSRTRNDGISDDQAAGRCGVRRHRLEPVARQGHGVCRSRREGCNPAA